MVGHHADAGKAEKETQSTDTETAETTGNGSLGKVSYIHASRKNFSENGVAGVSAVSVAASDDEEYEEGVIDE